jgi:hypothetical protein
MEVARAVILGIAHQFGGDLPSQRQGGITWLSKRYYFCAQDLRKHATDSRYELRIMYIM